MKPAYSQQRMPDLKLLDDLRERGVTRATFHADGELASVEFGPIASSDEPQHEAPKGPPKRVSATGGLVPRVGDSQ